MTMDKNSIKAVFGLIIFMFSVALAYFSASYVQAENLFDYWGMLAIFAGVYILVGIAVLRIFPVSLGFLFSADILVLHVMVQNVGEVGEVVRMAVVGISLVLLYAFAWEFMADKPLPPMGSAPLPPSMPPFMPPPPGTSNPGTPPVAQA